MTTTEEDSPDFIQKFEILEKLFKKHNLICTDETDHIEMEALDMDRRELVRKMGWDKMTIEELLGET